MLGFSSNKFFVFWLSLEISGLCVVPLFWTHFYSTQTFFYFLVTSFSGALLFFSWVNSLYFLRCLVMFFKIGLWPFSYWVINICQKLSFLRSYIFLFLLKFLPFYGIFKYFTNFFFIIIFFSFVKLLGATLKLMKERYYSVFNIFIWMSVSSISYWLLIGIYSFFFFLFCYMLYSFIMFFFLYYQNNNVVKYNLWIFSLLLFLGGPPLIYLFFKIFFFYNLAKRFFFIRALSLIFIIQRIVLIRALRFVGSFRIY